MERYALADHVQREFQSAGRLSPETARAVEGAVAVARAHGLRVDEPVILRDLTNVLVRLDPSPVVARVPRTLSRLRGHDWFALEVRVVSWLADAGAPVAAPSTLLDPGPHEHDGLVVSFWEVVDHDESRFDAAAGGRALHELHAALESCPEELPPFDRLDEIARLLDLLQPSDLVSQEEIDGMRAVGALLATKPVPPLRPIHGDAHLRNLLWTPDGPRWTDFENLCAGPVEYDLACISWRGRPEDAAALHAYGPHDERLRSRMEPYVALFLAPWTLTIAERHPIPEGIEEARRRVRRALEPLAR
jgi:aminoglycoside phosphotransferase (APT) family kinase protein